MPEQGAKVKMLHLSDEITSGQTEMRRRASPAHRVFRASGLRAFEVNLLYTGDDSIAMMNQMWRNKNAPTDVLSFCAWEGEMLVGAEAILGDIVISLETAERQAHAYGHDLYSELAILTAHGLAHLLGMDHERGLDDARIQAECEMTWLSTAGFNAMLALSGRAL